MAYRQMHLDKSGAGMAAKTACGRDILRTPLSTNWSEFKALPEGQQCAKCAASKQAELNAKLDKKALDAWEPEAQDAWMHADAALISANRKRGVSMAA